MNASAGMGVRRWWTVAFVVYVMVIFTATHWPQLKINAPGRPDLWIHLTVFSLWTVLLTMLARFGPRWSRVNICTAGIVTLAYAAFDESTQVFIPGRTATLEDYGANAGGVLLGTSVLLLIAWVRGRRLVTAGQH
jgi:VanZ family protein